MTNFRLKLLLFFLLILGAYSFVLGGLLAVHYHNHETGESADWYPVSDLRGDIVALIDAATGDQVASYAYSPFGQILQASGPAANKNPIRFQSKYFDADTGLVYFGLRHYSPQMSQWLSRDPMGEAGGLNLYAYAGNNPVNYADALGLKKVREIAPANPENPGRFPRYSMTIDDDGIIRTEVVTYQYFANNMISRWSARMRITNWAGRTEVGREWRKSTPQEIYEHYTFNENGELVPTSGAEYWERIWAAYRDEMHRIGAPLQDAIHGGLFIIDMAMPFPPVMAGGMLITRGSVHVGRGAVSANNASLRIASFDNLVRFSRNQRHHLNQTAAFRDVIPRSKGQSILLRGNIFRDVGAPHTLAHLSLEGFWNTFRGTASIPTNLQYTRALQKSLRASGLSEAQVQQAIRAAIHERVQHGLLGGMAVPRVPGPIRNIAQ